MCPYVKEYLSPFHHDQDMKRLYFIFVCVTSLPYGLLFFVKTMMALGTSVRYLNRTHPLYVLMGGSCFALANQLVFVLNSTIYKTVAARYDQMRVWLIIGSINAGVTFMGGNVLLSIFKKQLEDEGIDIESDFKQ